MKTSEQYSINIGEEIIEEKRQGVLQMFKKKTSEFTFDDGLVYSLEDSEPRHL